MQVISLFSGIGGFELAAEEVGWDIKVSCEINSFCRTILKYYWPKVYHHKDVKTLTYEKIKKYSTWNPKNPTIIVGGFPCQPFSIAGKRKGTEDNRNLWPEMYRIIKEIKPDWVVGENVHGIVNWENGMVFEQIQIDLESIGYETQAYILPAISVNAPHRRDRVWFVAHANNTGTVNHVRIKSKRKKINKEQKGQPQFKFRTNSNGITNTNNPGLQRGENIGNIKRERKKRKQHSSRFLFPNWEIFPTQPPLCGGNDGISEKLDTITFSKWRNESIKAYGNAVVPQVIVQIFKTIIQYELLHGRRI